MAARRAETVHAAKKNSRVRERVIELRKQNLPIYRIVRALAEQGEARRVPAAWSLVHEEGFANLPRRGDGERPAGLHPSAVAVGDVHPFNLAPRELRTEFRDGPFLLLLMLGSLGFDQMIKRVGLPDTKMDTTVESRRIFRDFINASAPHASRSRTIT